MKRFKLVDIAFVSVLILATVYLFPINLVVGGGMEPILKSGKHVISSRLSYLLTYPKRGDILIYYGSPSIARVVGLPGETVDFKAPDAIYVNGDILVENYIARDLIVDQKTFQPRHFELEPYQYLLVSDNRSSLDHIDIIKSNLVIAKVLYHQK